MFYLTMHSTHFIYGYMASDIWLRTILIVRKETRCRHIGYSYRLTARVLLYAPSHREDNTSFVIPVVEHRLEREIKQKGRKYNFIKWDRFLLLETVTSQIWLAHQVNITGLQEGRKFFI